MKEKNQSEADQPQAEDPNIKWSRKHLKTVEIGLSALSRIEELEKENAELKLRIVKYIDYLDYTVMLDNFNDFENH